MPAPKEQIANFVIKNTPSLERIERFRAVKLMFEVNGDEEFARDMEYIVHFVTTLRTMQGKPIAPKIGGMDRQGIKDVPRDVT